MKQLDFESVERNLRHRYFKLNSDELEDIVQVARIKWHTSGCYNDYGRARSAYNAALDLLRSEKRHHSGRTPFEVTGQTPHGDIEEYICDKLGMGDNPLTQVEDRLYISQALAPISSDDRELLYASAFMSGRDVAAVTGSTHARVRSRLNRVRKHIRERVQEWEREIYE